MDLLVDMGNSRLKWALSAPGVWRSGAAPYGDKKNPHELFEAAWAAVEKPRKMLVCCVSSAERLHHLQRWIQKRWSIAPHVVRSRAQQLGVKNRYHEPEQLGADRWAALVGARGLTTKAVCIVDAGTAVTVDALSAEGEFLGGVIFPGLHLLRNSLARGTEAVSAAAGNADECLARSTADGVAAGTLHGLAGAVERLIEEHRRSLGPALEVFLTGGDAPVLGPRLRLAVTMVPDLVLQGLARMTEDS